MTKLIDIHQANVTGLGAEKFASGVIEELENVSEIRISTIYINRIKESFDTKCNIIKIHYLLGIFSRLLEIFCWRFYREQKNEIVVLGDLPLNTSCKQYVLCHQSLVFESYSLLTINFYKYFLFRLIFWMFLKKDDVVLVQSQEMAQKFYYKISNKINVRVLNLGSHYYGWPTFLRTKRIIPQTEPETIRLFYPSAFYPHKNHSMLNLIELKSPTNIIVTIDKEHLPNCNNSLKFKGMITRDEVYELYQEVDALLFLSRNESLGLPILEAIKCNLPIICPYAEYTKELPSGNCFYFDLEDPHSLEDAISALREKIHEGWWPNWNFNAIYKTDADVSIKDLLVRKRSSQG
ncbi:glycosyltransferase [Amylibacter sp.]|nr:glycosyltransferase [Amylibacter sp.]